MVPYSLIRGGFTIGNGNETLLEITPNDLKTIGIYGFIKWKIINK